MTFNVQAARASMTAVEASRHCAAAGRKLGEEGVL